MAADRSDENLRVLVTGAAGFLGSVVCRRLVELGYDVRPTDRRPSEEAESDLVLVDLLEEERVREVIDGCDVVVHLANHTSDKQAGPPATYRENCAMNMHIFQAAADAGVERILYAGSTQVFSGRRRGDQPHLPSCLKRLPLNGRTPPCPGNAYAASKEAGEALLRYFTRTVEGLAGTTVRWPLLVDDEKLQGYRNRIPADVPKPDNLLDVGFTLLHVLDAADLIDAICRRGRQGYHCLLASGPENRLGWPVSRIIRTYYAEVPLPVPAERMESLIDTSDFRRLGWWPERSSLRPTPST